jgi:toxin ParE1/3/4
MTIIWSPLALERVQSIASYYAVYSHEKALRWFHGVFDSVDRLEDFPESGRMVPELNRVDIREILFDDHRVIYRVDLENIRILPVRHARQDWQDPTNEEDGEA